MLAIAPGSILPRKVFIIASLLVPIIGIGLYPKVLTQMYDATTTQLTSRLRASVPTLVEKEATAALPAVAMQAQSAPLLR